MKFIRSIQILGAVLFVLMQLTQAWGDFHSVQFSTNGHVYYQNGATQEEAQNMATYLESIGMDNADLKLEHRSGKPVVLLIPTEGASYGEVKEIGLMLEKNVFHEPVGIVACDNEFKTLYEVTSHDDLAGLPELPPLPAE